MFGLLKGMFKNKRFYVYICLQLRTVCAIVFFPIVPIGYLVFALIMEDEDSAGVVENK